MDHRDGGPRLSILEQLNTLTLKDGSNPKNIDTSLIYKKPNVGDLILFPSHIWHKVHPVKSGVRKSLVGWVLGKPFV